MYFLYDHLKPGTDTFEDCYADTDSMAMAKDSFFFAKTLFYIGRNKITETN